jgi:hypothetical protein
VTSELNVYSIISKNYLAHLRVSSRSLKKYRENVRHHVLLLDDDSDYLGEEDKNEFIFYRVEQVTDIDNLIELYRQYNPFELACIFKAKFARFLFSDVKLETLFYLDTDLFFYSSFQLAEHLLLQANIVLTPHRVIPESLKSRAEIYEEAGQLSTGLYNMGYFGLRHSLETLRFLDWWDERTETNCRRDLGRGFFDDQLWVNAAPVLFEEVVVIKDQGYNVSNWNLNERELSKKKNVFYANKSPLIFFHFSQANVLQEKFLTSYRNILVDEDPVLKEIYREYRTEMLSAGLEEIRTLPFSKCFELVP